MKRKLYFLLACMSATMFFLGSCCKESDEPQVDDNHVHDSTPTYSTGTKVSYPTFISDLGNGNAQGVKEVLEKRFDNMVSIDKAKVAIVSQEYLVAHSAEIDDLIDRKGVVIIVNPTGYDNMAKSLLSSDLDGQEFTSFLDHAKQTEEKRGSLMFAGLTGSQDYVTMENTLQDGMTEDEKTTCFDGLIDWVNTTCKRLDDAKKALLLRASAGTQPVDIAKTFNALHFTHIYSIHLNKRIAKVLWSNEDWLERSSTAALNVEVYPIHAFDDQPGHGDYYICNSVLSVYNAGMYRGIFHSKHGGVTVHMCGYQMKAARSKFFAFTEIGPASFPVSGIPTPETTSGSVSHTEGTSISITGGITGGVTAGKLTLTPSISVGGTFSNSTSVTFPDVSVQSIGDNKTVEHYWEVSAYAMGDIKGNSSCLYEPQSLMSRSTADLRQSWVWYLPDVKDYSTATFSFYHTLSLKYEAMKFYSTRVDFDRWTFDDATDGMFVIEIPNVNRTPTGTITVKNNDTNSGIEYVNKVEIYEAGTTKKVETRDETLVMGEQISIVVPVGNYDVVLYGGKTHNENTAYICANKKLERCDDKRLSTADFVKK